MLHRALFGSLERFFAILLEYYKGSFPLWLAPCQVIILPISEDQTNYAKKIEKLFRKGDLRVKIDLRDQSLNKKIREAELEKIPYIIILGKKEEREEKISVRRKGKGNIGKEDIEGFIQRLKKEVEEKVIF